MCLASSLSQSDSVHNVIDGWFAHLLVGKGYDPKLGAVDRRAAHLLPGACHLCPPGFCIRVLLQPPNVVPIENKVHLSQSTLGSSTNRVTFFPKLDEVGVLDECLPPDLD